MSQRAKRGKPFPKGKKNPGSKAMRPKTGAGRQPGSPNKFTRDIREAVLNALHTLGGDAYLVKLGQQEKKAFAMLLGKAMPLQVSGEGGGPIRTAVALSVSFKEPGEKE